MPSNDLAGLEILAPTFEGEWRAREEIDLVFMARDLGDLAGYAFDVEFDPAEMSLVEPKVHLRAADVFADNSDGYFKRIETGHGYLSVAAARRGKEWSASGHGEFLRLRIELRQEGFPASLQIVDAKMLSSRLRTDGNPVAH